MEAGMQIYHCRNSGMGYSVNKILLTGKQRTMRNLLIAAMLLAAIPTLAAEKLQVWVQADPGQPNNTDLQDSAQDIIKKLKSKLLELAESHEKADITIYVMSRQRQSDGRDEYATVDILVSISEIEEIKALQSRGYTWAGAADNARKDAEKWIKKRLRKKTKE